MLLMREGTGHASSHVGRIASFAYVTGGLAKAVS